MGVSRHVQTSGRQPHARGSHRKLRCRELLYTIILPGHRLEVEQAQIYDTITTAARMIRKRGESMRQRLAEGIALVKGQSWYSHSPACRLVEAFKQIGVDIGPGLVVEHPAVPKFVLGQGESAWEKHAIREMLRHQQWKKLAQRAAGETTQYKRKTCSTSQNAWTKTPPQQGWEVQLCRGAK